MAAPSLPRRYCKVCGEPIPFFTKRGNRMSRSEYNRRTTCGKPFCHAAGYRQKAKQRVILRGEDLGPFYREEALSFCLIDEHRHQGCPEYMECLTYALTWPSFTCQGCKRWANAA